MNINGHTCPIRPTPPSGAVAGETNYLTRTVMQTASQYCSNAQGSGRREGEKRLDSRELITPALDAMLTNVLSRTATLSPHRAMFILTRSKGSTSVPPSNPPQEISRDEGDKTVRPAKVPNSEPSSASYASPFDMY